MNSSILHESLIRCAAQCREFVNNSYNTADSTSESIVLSIDCAELCCQTSVLYRSDSVRTKAVAKQCLRTCENLLRHLAYCTEASSQRLIDNCQHARRCCRSIIEQTAVCEHTLYSASATVCYGITVPAGVYQA